MQLIDKKTKRIMEGFKERARDVGLSFEYETLEDVVSNRDMIKLMPKNMIPTLYDYWVHDVELFNDTVKQYGKLGEKAFFDEVLRKYLCQLIVNQVNTNLFGSQF